jgi:hypothetical protein
MVEIRKLMSKLKTKMGLKVGFDSKENAVLLGESTAISTMIQEANQFNAAPAEGYEYMLVKLTVSLTKNAKADATLNIFGGSFTLVSTAGKDYDSTFVVSQEAYSTGSLHTI